MNGEYRFRLFCRRRLSLAQRNALLRDNDLFLACCEEAHERYTKQAAGTLTDFLQWLLDHADEIIALIQKIIALFSEAATEPAT